MSTMESTDLVDTFINAFRSHAGGVVVVTTRDQGGENVGFTATSFASLSATPPRATFNVIKSSSSYRSLMLGKRIAVSGLTSEASDLGRRFAGPAGDRFSGEFWSISDGLPVIDDALFQLSGVVGAVHDYGTNAIVVMDITEGKKCGQREPLVYVNREFGSVSRLS